MNHIEILCRLYGIGYNLIPCNGKKPCVTWKQYQTERIAGANYSAWGGGRFVNSDGKLWSLQGGIVNWAMLTGSKPYSAAPALVCVDPDDAEAIALVRSRCPKTPAMQSTPKGGMHFLYRRPNVPYIGQTLGLRYKGRQFHLDIKADGNYIMSPGSRRDNGKTYQWDEPWTLELFNSLPIFDPAWLPDDQQPQVKKKYSAFDSHEDVVAMTLIPIELRKDKATIYLKNCPGSEQGRGADKYCFALAMTLLWGFLLPADDAIDLLFDWGQKETNVDSFGGCYSWSAKEIIHKINNALHTDYQKEVGDRLSPDAYLSQLFEELYG